MISLDLQGSDRMIEVEILERCGYIPPMPAVKRQLLSYQMSALFYLAKQYDRSGARMLEIGTGRGGSGYMLAKAAPRARVVSLTTDPTGADAARVLWKRSALKNIEVRIEASWNYLDYLPEVLFDLIFVDGDHNAIARDLPWYDRLKVNGLMLFHDYSPQDSPRPSMIAYDALNAMSEYLGRPFDVRIVDSEKTGMVGFYRREGESWKA